MMLMGGEGNLLLLFPSNARNPSQVYGADKWQKIHSTLDLALAGETGQLLGLGHAQFEALVTGVPKTNVL